MVYSGEIKVLFIDDDSMQLYFFEQMLKTFDQEIMVDTLEEPGQLLEKISSNKYDCIVVDYTMPRLNGIEVIQKIKEKWNIPCILYTGREPEDLEEEARKAEVDDFMMKIMNPEDYQILIQKIRGLVKK
jgi:CheY-like chemotaxis protein